MNEWQLIETAPTEPDHPILVWDGSVVVARHSNGRWWVDNTYGFCEDGQIWEPTHWMPLPEGPK